MLESCKIHLYLSFVTPETPSFTQLLMFWYPFLSKTCTLTYATQFHMCLIIDSKCSTSLIFHDASMSTSTDQTASVWVLPQYILLAMSIPNSSRLYPLVLSNHNSCCCSSMSTKSYSALALYLSTLTTILNALPGSILT